jgi:hypothetical protein
VEAEGESDMEEDEIEYIQEIDDAFLAEDSSMPKISLATSSTISVSFSKAASSGWLAASGVARDSFDDGNTDSLSPEVEAEGESDMEEDYL